MTAAPKPRARRANGAAEPRAITLTPPEGVPLRFAVAGLGGRFGAQIVDILITLLGMIAALLLVLTSGVASWEAVTIIGALAFFFIRAPYYTLMELRWNGQTLGKRAMGLRVVSGAGRSLSAYQVVARNLMREMEVFVPGTLLIAQPQEPAEALLLFAWIAGLLAVPLLNRRRQRLGDIIANTCVIVQPEATLTPDLAATPDAAQTRRFAFTADQLEHYGAYEVQVLDEFLKGGGASPDGSGDDERRSANMTAIGARIRAKIGYPDPTPPQDEAAFLHAFYLAQRDFLERKKLFGETRKDKFYREEDANDNT